MRAGVQDLEGACCEPSMEGDDVGESTLGSAWDAKPVEVKARDRESRCLSFAGIDADEGDDVGMARQQTQRGNASVVAKAGEVNEACTEVSPGVRGSRILVLTHLIGVAA